MRVLLSVLSGTGRILLDLSATGPASRVFGDTSRPTVSDLWNTLSGLRTWDLRLVSLA